MQKIVTHLWYDKEALEAATFYDTLFANSEILNVVTIKDTPSGDSETLTLKLAGQEFMMISAGPFFKFTPSISLRVDCETEEEVVFLYDRLSVDGNVLMKLGSYPFSGKHGWIEDRYGLSWQIMLVDKPVVNQKITPTLMFTGEQLGKAEEAIHYYETLFKNASVGEFVHYEEGDAPDTADTIKYAGFTLEDQAFAAMDSAQAHDFSFNESISFLVNCEDQEEIDYFWEKLSFVPEAEQCGWLKDKFGISWQIVPRIMGEMMQTKDPEKLSRVTAAFLKMKKFDIAELVKAFEGA